MELSFGEQIKIILKRKQMTIQDLAELYESVTGTKMTRQNLSQRLRRDNFQEQDMKLIAEMLGYRASIQLTPLPESPVLSEASKESPKTTAAPLNNVKEVSSKPISAMPVTTADGSTVHIPNLFRKQQPLGEINPLTGREYLSNTVRRHPALADYVQVYDRSTHEWIDVNEDYFWQFQANKKQILGSDYQEPILI